MALLARTPHRAEILPKHEPLENVDGAAAADVCSDTPIRLVPLLHLYSATSPCVSASRSSNVMSKKVKARKLASFFDRHPNHHPLDPKKSALTVRKPPIVNVYCRRAKRARGSSGHLSVFDMLIARNSTSIKIEQVEECDELESGAVSKKKKRRIGSSELVKLGIDSSVLCITGGPRLRKSRNNHVNSGVSPSIKPKLAGSACLKRWVRLSCSDVDPKTFIGLQCKVYWPLDDDWYAGHVIGYNPETNRHSVEYADGDEENLMLSNEKIKFYVSREDMQCLNLTFGIKGMESDGLEFSEMAVLAASLDGQELEPGDVIWAKLAGHATWPAIITDSSHIDRCKGLNGVSGGKSVPVQFFGTHDFARIKPNQVISFLEGLLSSLHLKCKKPCFVQSLEEAKMYLNEQKLPKRMMQMQNGINDDDPDGKKGEDGASADSGDDCMVHEGELRTIKTPPFQIGDLQVLCLGDVVKDSDCFKDDKFIWPEGYTAVRKFTSIKDTSVSTLYKMEVLRDAESKMLPIFKVTLGDGEQFKGSTPSACWNKIYKRIRKKRNSSSDGSDSESGARIIYKSGSDMFGFSDPKVFKLIQELSNSKLTSRYSTSKLASRRYKDLPVGYRPVRVDWKDLDKCSVCHMDEEYENNLFLQCDNCRMMVHARCYGELEPVDGVLWLCNLCRSDAPESPPPCCLCPVIGGSMKPTTDGRWAHLACAIWIPETCLSDVKRMEPIDGINRVSKDRWKLLCSICGVSYGACIQCSNITCRVAYHPLCARAAGLCVELEDEDRLHLISYDEDEEDQCIRLLSFCKKHRQPSNERPAAEDRTCQNSRECSNYTPPSNPSGCARSEPYNYFGRRGRKEPEALAAASLKRLFVENRPYLVNGNCRHESFGGTSSSSARIVSKFSLDVQKLKTIEIDAPKNILSMAEKYTYMKETFKKRLAFGKSRIHGFGIFTKHPHRAGDMVIEYTGELVRPSIADRREHFIYNSLVGAGTYMFRIDDERVIDATRFGSIAHLINHSCEPNCYSRVISVNGDEHIIIFAKRDIKRWEELSYDYRFFSIDEQLACYCGFPGCRSIVNDIDSEEQIAKLYVPCSELIDWRGE